MFNDWANNVQANHGWPLHETILIVFCFGIYKERAVGQIPTYGRDLYVLI